VIGLLLAIYPAGWRRRYGEEFRAVLESRPLGPFDVADVLIGALDARLVPRSHASLAGLNRGHAVMLRIGGFGAVAGAPLFFIGFAVASAFDGADAFWLGLAAVGTLGILAGLIGLSAFQAYRNPKLAWAAFAVPGIGALVSVIGMTGMAVLGDTDQPFIGSWSPWDIWIVGFVATLLGSILFGIATVRAAVLSRRGAQALVLSAVAVLVVAFGGVDAGAGVPGMVVVASTLGAFCASWVVLGATALQRGPIRAVAATT
jgi:hypothetical protein